MKNIITLIICILSPILFFGQGKIPMRKKSFTAALEFLPDGKLAEGYSRVKMEMSKEKDPFLDPEKWYTEGNDQMRGFVGDAVLFLQWWTTSYSPAERYKFDWTSSGYFELDNLLNNPITPNKRINRSDLQKYPNLLKRFDNIAPLEIEFELTFRTGGIPDQEYWDFRKRHNLNTDLGSLGYAVSYKRKLDGDFILYKMSRKKQDWINPGPIPGGWDTFLNIPEKLNDKKSKLIELFKMGENLVIENFKITNIKWRISDFVYIAQKYEDYESGKEKPSVFDEIEQGEKEKKAGDGFWDETDIVDSETEPFYDQQTKKYGIRTKKGRVIVSGKYDNIGKGDKYYIAKIGNTAYLLNNMGGVLKTKTYPNIYSINSADLTVTLNSETDKIEGTLYEVRYNERDSLLPGKEGVVKNYSINRGFYLLVESASDRKKSQEEKDRERKESEIYENKMIQETKSRFESMGYKSN